MTEIPRQSWQFPQDSEQYIAWAKDVVEKTPSTHEEIIDGYGIDWYEICPQREPIENHLPQRVVFFSGHADDAEFAAAVTLANHAQEGDHVSVLLFTLGSAGRYNRGFTEKTLPGVRLAEAIEGAKIMGIQRIGVVTLTNGKQGFPEWFWVGNEPQMRRLGVGLAGRLDPQILYSPHEDREVDTHPDHQAVAQITVWTAGWGTEVDFYRDSIPGKPTDFQEWRLYSIWPGRRNISADLLVSYQPDGPFADLKRSALTVHQSQFGEGYAMAASGRDVFQGTMRTVGLDRISCAEVFAVRKAPTVVEAKWRE